MELRAGRDEAAFDYYAYLDGVKLEECVAANDVEGWADVLVDHNEQPLAGVDETKRLYGKVTFVRCREVRAA